LSGTGLTPRHICTGTGRTPATAARALLRLHGERARRRRIRIPSSGVRRELPLIETLAEVHRHLGPMDKVLWGQAIWSTPDEPTIAATMDAADKLLKPGGLGIWKGTAAFNTRRQSASERDGCGPFHHLCAGTSPRLLVLGLEAAKPRATEYALRVTVGPRDLCLR
jgi:hypothetical protein